MSVRPSLVGTIVERTPSSSLSSTTPRPPDPSSSSRTTGFPAVHHRSAFARARDNQRTRSHDAERSRAVPTILPTRSGSYEEPQSSNSLEQGVGFAGSVRRPAAAAASDKNLDASRDEISAQNERIVAAMSDVERREQREEILGRFGPDIGGVLRRAREQRLKLQQGNRKRQIDEVSSSEVEREQHPDRAASDIFMHSAARPDSRDEWHETQTQTFPAPPTPHAPRPQRGILLTSPSRANSPPPVSRTSTPSARKLRFADVTPDDIHVYASQPPSPRRTLGLLLPAPPPLQSLMTDGGSDAGRTGLDNIPIVQLPYKGVRIPKLKSRYDYDYDDSDDEQITSKVPPSFTRASQNGTGLYSETQPEEGTPEDIRRRFFPHLPPRNPNLEWIEGPLRQQAQRRPFFGSSYYTGTANEVGARTTHDHEHEDASETFSETTRTRRRPAPVQYDLSGMALPPSSDGEGHEHSHAHAHGHHHPSPSSSGQTLANLCELTQSSVAAQRSSALDVLAKIVRRVRESRNSSGDSTSEEDPCTIRLRALNASLGVLLGRGNLGGGVGVTVRAVELLNECVVSWDEEWNGGLEWGFIETKQAGNATSTGAASASDGLFDKAGEDGEEDADDGLDTSAKKAAAQSADPLSTIPLPYFLPRVEALLTPASTKGSLNADDAHPLPARSRSHLLSVLHTLAQYSREVAHEILSTGSLLRVVLDTFVATPVPTSPLIDKNKNTSDVKNTAMDVDTNPNSSTNEIPTHSMTFPDPLALKLLSTIAASARDDARALVDAGVPDLLLRFVVTIGSSPPNANPSFGNQVPIHATNPAPSLYVSPSPFNASPYPPELAVALFTETLEFYAVLARYGMYTRVATDAAEWWGRLGRYVSEERSAEGFRTLSGRESDAIGDMLGKEALVQSDTHFGANHGEPSRSTSDTSPGQDRTAVSSRLSNRHVWLSVSTAYLRLIHSWLVCARDPHTTTPPHEILWSQVKGWAWGDELLQMYHRFDGNEAPFELCSVLWETTAAWLEGCRVNEVKGGEGERGKVNAVVGEGSEVLAIVKRAGEDLRGSLGAVEGEEDVAAARGLWEKARIAGRCLGAAAELCVACLPSGNRGDDVAPSDGYGWVKTVHEALSDIIKALLGSKILDFRAVGKEPNHARVCAFAKPISAFLSSYAKLFHRMAHLPGTSTPDSAQTWVALSTAILQRLLPGDEDAALWILEELMKAWSSLPTPFPEHGFNNSTLIPFLAHSVRPKLEIRLSPISPTPTSVQYSTMLTLPSTCVGEDPAKTEFGLPLPRDWPSCALDHLLRSGVSPVLAVLPSSLNISEVEIVRATMTLVVQTRRAVVDIDAREDGLKQNWKQFAMSCEETVFACMKVFMLEHEQQQGDSSEEVYRDVQVGHLMEEALRPFTYSASRNASVLLEASRTHSADLEAVSRRFLGTSTPFFQFYTDFVALYDAVSFSHKLFARLLLVPTGMQYALDYRKHLWGDFGHLIKGIHTPIGDVLTYDLKQFLWPFETDGQMIGWYLRALVKAPLEGFVRLVAVHHVACNIWADLQDGPVREKRAKMLLLAVVGQCKFDVVHDVVRYKQEPGGEIKLPPACFPRDGEWKAARLACVAEWGGIVMRRSLEKLFLSNE